MEVVAMAKQGKPGTQHPAGTIKGSGKGKGGPNNGKQ
jgi:hypothetical protein